MLFHVLRLRLAEARSPPQHHRVVSQALLNSLLLTHPECFCTLNLLAVPPMCQAHSCLRVFAQPKKKNLCRAVIGSVPLRISPHFLYQESRATYSPGWDSIAYPSTRCPSQACGQRLLGSAWNKCQSLSKNQSQPTAFCCN